MHTFFLKVEKNSPQETQFLLSSIVITDFET